MKYLVFVLSGLGFMVAACSSENNSLEPGPAMEVTATRSPGSTPAISETAAATPAAQAQLSDLTLVWVDASRGQGAELYAGSYDGSNARKVANLPSNRIYDVRGNTAVAAGPNELLFADLKTGATRPIPITGFVATGRFVDEQTFVYSISNGCGPNGGPRGVIYKVNVPAQQQSTLVTSGDRDFNIVSVDAALGQIGVVPRGCDVAVRQVQVYALADGRLIQTYDTEGCGWVAFALSQRKVITSRQFCTPPPDKRGVDATVYDVVGIVQSIKDVTAPNGGASLRPFVLRPGRAEAALGAEARGSPGPGGAGSTGTGIWLLDLNTQAFTNLAPGQGQEQWAVSWSPDGRFLLTAATIAQGTCTYSYIDVTTKEVKPIASSITFCGADGDVIGWTLSR